MAEGHHAICVEGSVDQLSQSGNSEAFSQIVATFFVPACLSLIDDTSTQARGDAGYHIQVVGLSQGLPQGPDVRLILWRSGELVGCVDTVVVEEYTQDFVPFV